MFDVRLKCALGEGRRNSNGGGRCANAVSHRFHRRVADSSSLSASIDDSMMMIESDDEFHHSDGSDSPVRPVTAVTKFSHHKTDFTTNRQTARSPI